jgi:hypothetical protein
MMSVSSTLAYDTSEASSSPMTVPSTPRESEIIPMLPAEPSTAIPAVTPPEERKTFYSPLAAFLRARYPSVRTAPLQSTGNGAPNPKSSLANEVRATSPSMGEPFQSHGDTSESSQTTSEDEDDISLADIAETATLRGTPTASRTSRAGSTSTVKASISIEAPEATANEKTIRSTSVPPKVVQEST